MLANRLRHTQTHGLIMVDSEQANLLPTPGELTDLRLPQADQRAQRRSEEQLDRLVDLLTAERSLLVQGGQTSSDCKVLESVPRLVELSVVLPCLNQAYTLGNCILKAATCFERLGIDGEVIVADYGSRDDSVEIAETLGARLIHVEQSNEWAALSAGVEAARGDYVLVGPADDSYDLSQAGAFYRKLESGADLVHGCRLRAGGGRMLPGALPWISRLGNSVLSRVVRWCFAVPVHDVMCRFQAFRKGDLLDLIPAGAGQLDPVALLARATADGRSVAEVPIKLAFSPSSPASRGFQAAFDCLREFRSSRR